MHQTQRGASVLRRNDKPLTHDQWQVVEKLHDQVKNLGPEAGGEVVDAANHCA